MSKTQTLRPVGQLDELLLERGLITHDQLAEAHAVAGESGLPLGKVLVRLGTLTEAALVAVLAELMNLEFIELSEAQIDASAVALIPESTARKHNIMPVRFEDDGRLTIAMANPGNVVARDDIRAITGRETNVVVATPQDVSAAISRHYRLDHAAESLVEEVAATQEEEARALEAAMAEAGAEDAPIIKLVNLLITQAINDRASDIHVEPGERGVRVRYRVDGVLHEMMTPPKSVQAGLTSRLKIMADINIAERRVPQDGRISLTVQGKAIDIRVATLPTVHGEKIVMRLLDKSSVLLKLEDLGFAASNMGRYRNAYAQPYGMILVTGPTGSGKSTTLYATLNIRNSPDVNIITVEDPVEYRLAGINQVQINPKAGLTFASALRSILRSDPDIILVGEIRDRETAQIAVESALTGHLVLSTLHTNDAPSALTRLTEMGIEPFLVGSALDCVLAQRLARRLCGRCKQAYSPEQAELESMELPLDLDGEVPVLYRAVGCSACSGTGYRGRIALHEVMTVTEEVERMVIERSSSEDIAKVARAQGMLPLRQDGMQKVLEGQTSVEEILRVVV